MKKRRNFLKENAWKLGLGSLMFKGESIILAFAGFRDVMVDLCMYYMYV